MSYITRANESFRTYEGAMSGTWMSHDSYQWVMSHISTRQRQIINKHVMAHMTESRLTSDKVGATYKCMKSYEWVMSHMNESCHAHAWVVTHISMCHDSYINVSCLIFRWGHVRSCVVTHQYAMARHIWIRHGRSHMNTPWQVTHEHAMAHVIWTSHVVWRSHGSHKTRGGA